VVRGWSWFTEKKNIVLEFGAAWLHGKRRWTVAEVNELFAEKVR